MYMKRRAMEMGVPDGLITETPETVLAADAVSIGSAPVPGLSMHDDSLHLTVAMADEHGAMVQVKQGPFSSSRTIPFPSHGPRWHGPDDGWHEGASVASVQVDLQAHNNQALGFPIRLHVAANTLASWPMGDGT